MDDRERLIRYVRRKFEAAKKENWPTVRECARGLKISQADVELLADEGAPLMLTAYNVRPAPLMADHFVEICE
jgi:hypothetical protein